MDEPEKVFEALLGREVVPPDSPLMSTCTREKSVLVTGAGGSIGIELCRQLLSHNPACLILLDVSEFALYSVERELRQSDRALGEEKCIKIVPVLGCISNRNLVEKVIQHYRVDTIYHSAAFKHVPMLERNPVAAVENNVFGSLVIARAAEKLKVGNFILISTDKAVRPVNIMGATKRFAEQILQSLNARGSQTCFSMVRFGNVLGSSGSVLPLFYQQIQSGGPVTVTHKEMARYFMTSREAAQLVIQAGALARGGDVFVLDMSRPVRIDDMAKKLIRLMGFSVCESGSPRACSCEPCADGKGIAINYTGLREGEKLNEELLIGSTVTGTSHSKILRAVEDCLDWPALERLLGRLELACAQTDHDSIRKTLDEAVICPATREDRQNLTWITIDAMREAKEEKRQTKIAGVGH